MKQCLKIGMFVIAALTAGANAAYAWHVAGYIRCDSNGNGTFDTTDLPLAGILVTVNGIVQPFDGTGTATTDANGYYSVRIPEIPGSFTVTIAAPNGAAIVLPSQYPYPFTTSDAQPIFDDVNFLIHSQACTQSACWLTGGGAKFSPIIGGLVAEKGPQHSFGGNVNPGCNPESGEGGNWNHVAHALKLHFQGQAIKVERCGNVVPPPPPGSESPETPFNFIEFSGTGVLKGIQGNKVEFGPVTFWARAEDRNEPGSNGAKDGALIDRYLLRVTTITGAVPLLVDDGAGNPVRITDGNLQIHISSCAITQ